MFCTLITAVSFVGSGWIRLQRSGPTTSAFRWNSAGITIANWWPPSHKTHSLVAPLYPLFSAIRLLCGRFHRETFRVGNPAGMHWSNVNVFSHCLHWGLLYELLGGGHDWGRDICWQSGNTDDLSWDSCEWNECCIGIERAFDYTRNGTDDMKEVRSKSLSFSHWMK